MYSVDTAARRKIRSGVGCTCAGATRVVTELKNVSASSGPRVIDQPADVEQLGALCHTEVIVNGLGPEVAAQALDVLEHALES